MHDSHLYNHLNRLKALDVIVKLNKDFPLMN
jgi:hypothetical protein